MNVKQMSKLTGLSSHTLRYYEKIGLLLDIKRDANGFRHFSKNDLEWIEFLKKAKSTRMSLADIKSFALLRKKGDSSIGERITILEKHRKKLQSELSELQIFLATVEFKIKLYKEMAQKIKNT